MKRLTTSATASLAADHTRPVVLVTLTARSTSQGTVTYRWASQADGDGSGGYRIGGSGTTYLADIADVERIVRTLPARGGIFVETGGDVVLANPDLGGDLWSDLFATRALDDAVCTVELALADGSETAADLIQLAQGQVSAPVTEVQTVSLLLGGETGTLRHAVPERRRMTREAYPYAPAENWGRIRPVVLGDMTGRAFDLTTPGSGAFPHVPLLTANTRRQQADLFDDATGGDRETLIRLDGEFIEVPDTEVTVGDGLLEMDDNVFYLWLTPSRIDPNSTATIVDAEYAFTSDLEQAAFVRPATALMVDMPAVADDLGALGESASLVAADVTIYTVYSKLTPSDTNPCRVTVRIDGSGISGHTALSLDGSDIAVDAQEVGDHISSWDDLGTLSLLIYGEPALSGVYVHRIAMRVRFRCSEVDTAFTEQRLYRSMAGFTEDAGSALADYRDGTYVRGDRTATPLTHPADIAEAVLRERSWGLGLTATSLESTGATLAAAAYPATDTFAVTSAAAIAAGDRLLIDEEVMLVTDIDGTTVAVTRGFTGSRATCHLTGAAVWKLGEDGDVDSAGFRAAAGLLREPGGVELLTNGGMEGAFTAGIAPDWSEYDPSDVGTPASCDGYAGRYGQQVTRTASDGYHPGVQQSLSGLTAGTWYRVELFVRCTSGSSAVQCSVAQTPALHPDFTVDMTWRRITFDAQAASTGFTLRLRNAGASGDTVQFDDVSVRELQPWRMGFALTEEYGASEWFDTKFLPQCGLRMGRDAQGRLTVSARERDGDAPAVATIDGSCIAVDRDGAPMLNVARTPLNDVASGATVRYAYNAIAGQYDGYLSVGAASFHTGQHIASVTSGDPLDTIGVADSGEIAPKDSGDEAGNIVASGTTVTLPSGDLVNAGVVAGDWLIVQVSYGTFLHQIASVTDATHVELAERPPQYADPGQWSTGTNLYLAGSEIFGVCDTPTATTARIFRRLDDHNLTTVEELAAGDAILALATSSDDGTGERDQTGVLRDARERTALHRIARHRSKRTITFDAPYIRDRQTALFLRNQLFDDADRAWIVTVTTDLSTLALDVGDRVTVEHELVPGGTLTGEVTRQAVDVLRCMIEYAVRGME